MCDNKIENCWYMNGERCLDFNCEERKQAWEALYPDEPFTLTVVSKEEKKSCGSCLDYYTCDLQKTMGACGKYRTK